MQAYLKYHKKVFPFVFFNQFVIIWTQKIDVIETLKETFVYTPFVCMYDQEDKFHFG